MPRPKGIPKTGGRAKGTPNKATARSREALLVIVDGNIHKVQGWLDQIEEKQGALAVLNAFGDLIEFVVPKLQRTELTGEGGGPVQIKGGIRLVKPNA